jgi:hypothetical protein
MYTKLALRILESLTVYQFNDYFYTMLKGLIIYLKMIFFEDWEKVSIHKVFTAI